MSRLRDHLIPTLDGEALETETDGRGRAKYVRPDGTQIDQSREQDLVFVNTTVEGPWWDVAGLTGLEGRIFDEPMGSVEMGAETFSRRDVQNILRHLAEGYRPASGVELTAGFFHRSLVAFADGDAEGDVPWSRMFWKAEYAPVAPLEGAPEGAQCYRAVVHTAGHDAAQTVHYWVTDHASEWVGPALSFDEDETEGSAPSLTSNANWADALFD